MNAIRSLALAFMLVATATLGCSAPAEDDAEGDGASALDLAHANVDVELVSGFPSLHRDQMNFLGEQDEEIAEWSLHYVVTPDGFDGVVAFGKESNGTVRYLTALDSKTRITMVLDGVALARNSEAAAVEGERSEAALEFVAKTFDEVTVQWLRSELYRMLAQLEEATDANESGKISVRSFSAKEICAARLAIYAASTILPFTKVPLIGRASSLTAQFVGSFVIDAVGSAAIGQMTEAAKSSAAAAASGAALASVLKTLSGPLRSVGASGAGVAASFVVGAMLGTDGDLQLLPGDRVEKSDGQTIIVHADGSRTTIASGGAYGLLPTVCRQALGKRAQ